MILALGILLAVSFAALPFAFKRYISLKASKLPVLRELNKPLSFSVLPHHRVFHYSKAFSNSYFFKSNRRHYYTNNLRLYSVFEWVKKFEQEDQLLQWVRNNLHQARLSALRLKLLKAVVLFQVFKQSPQAWLVQLTYKNKNFLHPGLVHHLAQP